MRRFFYIIGVSIFGIFTSVVAAQTLPSSALLGGDTTVIDASSDAFTNPLPQLTNEQLALFNEGDHLFEVAWRVHEGLGPILNATSCEACHPADGRGRPPAFTGEIGTGFLVRLARNQQTANGSPMPDPIYGGQFQDDATRQMVKEGTVSITYYTRVNTYPDGTTYTLYEPHYDLIDLGYGELDSETTLSPRIGTQMIGLGLLEAVPADTLLALTDPTDADGDGISGRVNYVWDNVADTLAIGRFGWKASEPTLLQQNAGAFNGDMGMTSSLNPLQPCTDNQSGCFNDTPNRHNNGRNGNRQNNQPPRGRGGHRPPANNTDNNNNNPPPPAGQNSNSTELGDHVLHAVTTYTSSLAVPAQRNPNDPQVLQGQALFDTVSCSSCHMPTLQTGAHAINALSNQTIHPYTDLLLHDMGDGLADGQLVYQADGNEWRTAPLWGIGLFEEVNGYAFYLHDGRARTLEEAIMWHGGEAEASRDAFANLSAQERDALIAFLKSL
jgi:CxxC motif-containing protein (DUF1111 family)